MLTMNISDAHTSQKRTNLRNKDDIATLGISNAKADDLLGYFNENRKAGLFNDVTIQCDNEQFSANKKVLSCYSGYFKTMFDIEMKEKYQDTVEIKGFDAAIIKMLIDYMYGEKVFINTCNVMQVLLAADYLQLPEVKNNCIDFLQVGLTIDNCLEALIAYDAHRPTAQLDHMYHFIGMHFSAVVCQGKLKQLSKHQISMLLAKLNKNEVSQELVFKAANDWVCYDESNRNQKIQRIFGKEVGTTRYRRILGLEFGSRKRKS